MRIAIDAMGGDQAPEAPVAGALRALEAFDDVEIVLAGDPAQLEEALGGVVPERIRLHDAPETVGSQDPVKAVRSSPRVSARACADLLHAGEVEGVLTMGSTGAAVAAATLYCRRLAGVKRTGIAVPLPRATGPAVCIDGGANPDARPEHLYQYALMAMHYARAALDIENPRIGLLSIGEEASKGNRLVLETRERFDANPPPNFVGHVEPHAVFEGAADVVVCDGFTGNIVLKTAEGIAGYILSSVPAALADTTVTNPLPVIAKLASTVDYSQYGGAPLLGVEGAYLIGHGRSGPEAFFNGVRVIRSYVLGKVGERIIEQFATAEETAS